MRLNEEADHALYAGLITGFGVFVLVVAIVWGGGVMKREIKKISSNFAVVDVTEGRYALRGRIRRDGPQKLQLTVVIDYPEGSDDGVSIEYEANVIDIKHLGSEIAQ